MNALVRAAVVLRRFARSGWPLSVGAFVALLTVAGIFADVSSGVRPMHIAAAVAWAIALAYCLVPRLAKGHSPVPDLHVALILLVGVHALVQASGGLTGASYPLVYLFIAFTASFMRGATAIVIVGAAVAFEFVLYFATDQRAAAGPFLVHMLLIVLFGALNLLFTRAELARVRRSSERQVEQDKERLRNETRMFRLVSPVGSGLVDVQRLHQSSVDEVHHALYYVLQLLHRTMRLHTCVLLMPPSPSEPLRVAELVTDSDNIAEGPFVPGAGAVGAAVKQRVVTNLGRVKEGYTGICYYARPATVRAFVAVPIVDAGVLVGVLCADRLNDEPFTKSEEAVLVGSIHHILRALENERVFVQLERSKREKDILHRASQSLGTALDAQSVTQAAFDAAAEISSFDFAALALYVPEGRKYEITRAVGERAERFEGLRYRDNHSLTAMAVKNKHYLPYRGEFDPKQQFVFTKRSGLKDMASALVLPLIVREQPIGALVLAAKRANAFGDTVRPTLQVLSNQFAAALANAAAVKRLEELATVDALSGCLNKRAFMDAFEARIVAAERFDRKLSLVVIDLDHFKAINDRHGHATGDRVLRELGHILRRIKRETDEVGRFGGEEFCILCEETNTRGAIQLAERVRQELTKMTIQTEDGVLRVTASLGVATFPDHARNAQALFEVSDKALYFAKSNGRDQVCAA